MRLLRPFPQLAAGILFGLLTPRLPAAQPADPWENLPRCPDEAAALELQQKLSTSLQPDGDLEIRADNIEGTDGEDTLEVSGNVTIRQGEHELRGERLKIDRTESGTRVNASETVEYRNPQLVVRGSSFNASDDEVTFENSQFELPTRAGRGSASRFSADDTGIVKLKDAQYTTCPADKPDWRLRADDISLDTTRNVGVARDPRLEFLGVTLLRLPAISFPVGDARKSGLLFPSLGTSTRGGVQVSQPLYLNIAPQQDFTFTPTWFTSRGIDLEGEYRYLTRHSHGELLGNLLPHDGNTGEARNRWRIGHVTELSGNWRLTLAGENVSDTRYYEDFAQTGTDGASTPFLPRLAELAWRSANLHAGVLVRNFQTLDEQLLQADRPATEAPRFYLRGERRLDGALPLVYGVEAEATRFRHSGEVQGWRLDAQPRVGLDFSGMGYFFRPTAMLDAAGYRLSNTAPGADDNPTRTLPVLSVDTGLIFEREGGRLSERYLTLEPRLMYLYAPYRDQDELPLFDTSEPDLNWIELFRSNRYVGLDRISDANQVNLGFTTQMYSDSGARILSTTIGQTFNFRSPRVRLPGEPPDAGDASDLIAQAELTAWRNWSVSTGIQWNPYADRTERAEMRLQYQPESRSVLNLGYRYQNGRLEQAEASFAWPVTPSWRVYGRTLYSLRENKSIEQFAGFEYSSCCWSLRAVGRDYVGRRTGARDRSIYVQLELKGLSNVGQAADAFLEKAIRGYSTRRRP